jgi:peptidoglycan/xylan/chitin deacetylase (PgdA/CDA1 family)
MAAHSQYHVDVSKTSAIRAEIEIFGAKSDLENHLGHPVVDWAYPYGGYNYSTVQLVHKAGYWSAVTTRPGGWHDVQQMPLLRRVRVDGRESLAGFIASLRAN